MKLKLALNLLDWHISEFSYVIFLVLVKIFNGVVLFSNNVIMSTQMRVGIFLVPFRICFFRDGCHPLR